jgi:hypothetical protein
MAVTIGDALSNLADADSENSLSRSSQKGDGFDSDGVDIDPFEDDPYANNPFAEDLGEDGGEGDDDEGDEPDEAAQDPDPTFKVTKDIGLEESYALLWNKKGESKIAPGVLTPGALAWKAVSGAFASASQAKLLEVLAIDGGRIRERIVKHLLASLSDPSWVKDNARMIDRLLGTQAGAQSTTNDYVDYATAIQRSAPNFLKHGIAPTTRPLQDRDSQLFLTPGSFDSLNRMFWVLEAYIAHRLSGASDGPDIRAAMGNASLTPPVHMHLQTILDGGSMEAVPAHFRWTYASQAKDIADQWDTYMGFS